MLPRDRSDYADDQQLVRYLLGLVHGEDAEWLDEASVADDEVAARLRVVEDDLCDAYANSKLAGDMLERFESRYLASPRRRGNVTFARGFIRAVNRAAPADAEHIDGSLAVSAGEAAEASTSTAPSADRTAPRSKLALRLMASAALLLVACGMLVFRAARPRNGLDVAEKDRIALGTRTRELDQRLDDQRAANTTVTRELERLPKSPAALASRAALEPPPTALVLLPQTRAAVEPIPTLTLLPGAGHVALELRLESNDFPRYQVALNDPASNHTVWRSDPIVATVVDRAPTVSVILPTHMLKPQHYSLALIARTGSDATVVGSYTFQVVRH